MKLNSLISISHRSKKRLGRGHGSGRGGHTSGRGAKGDKARGKNKLLFEGVKTKKSLIKRLPFTRGKAKLRPQSASKILNLSHLNSYQSGDVVDYKSLLGHGLISSLGIPVKILGQGKVQVPLKVSIPCSRSAANKITAVGGEIVTTGIGPTLAGQ